jgi:hypothetical protein
MFSHFLIALALLSTALLGTTQVLCQEVSDQQREIFRAAKTARIVVNESYERAPGVKLSFEQTARGILKYVGLSLVGAGEVADVTFQIEATGSPLSRNYQDPSYRRSGTVLYTGAIVRGSLNVSAGNSNPIVRSFYGKVDTPRSIFDTQAGHYDSPAKAPFASAFISGKTTFLDILGQLLIDIYGPSQVATAFIDEDLYVSNIGREALLMQDLPTAFSISIDAIRQNSPNSRRAGSIALTAIVERFPQAVDLLLAASSDKDPNVRTQVIYTLTPVNDPRVREVMIQALRDSDKSIRILGASRLEYTYDKRATELLLIALRDKDPAIRRSAAAALKLAGVRAIEPLIAALKDKDEYVRRAAHESLKVATRQELGIEPKGWQKWWKENKPIYEKAEAQMQQYLEVERQRKQSKP